MSRSDIAEFGAIAFVLSVSVGLWILLFVSPSAFLFVTAASWGGAMATMMFSRAGVLALRRSRRPSIPSARVWRWRR